MLPGDAMRIAQITDAHLRPPGMLYQGVADTAATLAAAVAALNALDPAPDAVVFTGDLGDMGTPDEYARASAILSDLTLPLLLLPGNHDDRDAFRAAFPAGLPATGPLHWRCADLGPLRLIGLDVTVPGDHHGMVDADAAAWLAATLADDPTRPTLIFLHQPPLTIGITALDELRCFGEAALAAALAKAPGVLALCCGHVHRQVTGRLAGTPVITAPSLAPAIALRLRPDATPASLGEPPGFLLHLWSDGQLVTHLIPIGTFPGPWDFY